MPISRFRETLTEKQLPKNVNEDAVVTANRLRKKLNHNSLRIRWRAKRIGPECFHGRSGNVLWNTCSWPSGNLEPHNAAHKRSKSKIRRRKRSSANKKTSTSTRFAIAPALSLATAPEPLPAWARAWTQARARARASRLRMDTGKASMSRLKSRTLQDTWRVRCLANLWLQQLGQSRTIIKFSIIGIELIHRTQFLRFPHSSKHCNNLFSKRTQELKRVSNSVKLLSGCSTGALVKVCLQVVTGEEGTQLEKQKTNVRFRGSLMAKEKQNRYRDRRGKIVIPGEGGALSVEEARKRICENGHTHERKLM